MPTPKRIRDIQDIHEYDSANWRPIRDEARIDMRFVAGNPWNDADRKLRGKRPSIAPEEMAQYRNQVINALMMNPRGMKFSPVGGGASEAGAKFYQAKAREVEYRSHATHAYAVAAENALMRSYGFVRINVRRATRSTNQEIWIDPVPNPNMILPDTDFVKPDLSGMQHCFVEQWIPYARLRKEYGKSVANAQALAKNNPKWFTTKRARISEFWEVGYRKRQLVLAQPLAMMVQGPGAPPAQPSQLFEDEIDTARMAGYSFKPLEEVDYPEVTMSLVYGNDFLSEDQPWMGKYIPIVGCFGKVLYLDEDGENDDRDGSDALESNRQILSMTRFGRDPWKAYCYACSQELEVLGMVPRAPMRMYKGQADLDQYQNLVKSMKMPVAALEFNGYTEEYVNDGTRAPLPLPEPVSYVQVQLLQALEVVREGFRRAIQSAMASNFLPTDAGSLDEKTGIALGNIQKAAERGTYHFVQSYEDMVRQCGVIFEDLVPHIHDAAEQTGVIDASGTATMQGINGFDAKSIDTAGDYLVTVSAGQSSDSDRQAATEFTDSLVQNLQGLAPIIGPEKSAAIVAVSIRNRGLGPMGDAIADIVEPPSFKPGPDGKPPDPQMAAMQAQLQQMQQLLQRAAQEKQAKIIEQDGKFRIATMQEQAEDERNRDNNATKIYVAELSAKVDRMALLIDALQSIEDRKRETAHLAAEQHHASVSAGREHGHAASQSLHERAHAAVESAKDRAHEHIQGELERQHAATMADQAAEIAAQQTQESPQ